MGDVASAIAKLDEYATELDDLSRKLAKLERDLEPVAAEYDGFVDDFEIGLYRKSVEDGSRLPSEALRVKLAREAMPPELLGRYTALTASRERMLRRIATLKRSVDAQRSILSAHKAELEATR